MNSVPVPLLAEVAVPVPLAHAFTYAIRGSSVLGWSAFCVFFSVNFVAYYVSTVSKLRGDLFEVEEHLSRFFSGL